MDITINFEKKHFIALAVLISFVGLILIGSAEDVNQDLPYHYLQQVAVNSTDMTSVDENEDGVIDQAEDSDTVDNQHWSDIQTWVNSNDDVNDGDTSTSNEGADNLCGSSSYLRGDSNCRTASQIVSAGGGDGYIGDYDYGGHDAGSDLNMGYNDLCLNGDCRNSWPSTSGGDGYLPDDPASSDVDMNGYSIFDADRVNAEKLVHMGGIEVLSWLHMGGNQIHEIGQLHGEGASLSIADDIWMIRGQDIQNVGSISGESGEIEIDSQIYGAGGGWVNFGNTFYLNGNNIQNCGTSDCGDYCFSGSIWDESGRVVCLTETREGGIAGVEGYPDNTTSGGIQGREVLFRFSEIRENKEKTAELKEKVEQQQEEIENLKNIICSEFPEKEVCN